MSHILFHKVLITKELLLFVFGTITAFTINVQGGTKKSTQITLLKCLGFFLIIGLLVLFNNNELVGTYLLIIYVGAMSILFTIAYAVLTPVEKHYKAPTESKLSVAEKSTLVGGVIYVAAVVIKDLLSVYIRHTTQPLTDISIPNITDYQKTQTGGLYELSQVGTAELAQGITYSSELYLLGVLILLIGLCCVLTILDSN